MAETVKHTPGPWEFIDATNSATYKFAPTCIIKSGDKQIASFSWNDNSPWFPTKAESQANARLIAAAPDLLEVVLLIQEKGWSRLDTGDGMDIRKMALAAVQKALPPISLGITREWFERRAKAEADLEIGAGFSVVNMTDDDIARMEVVAERALPKWAQDELARLRAVVAKAKAGAS